VTNVQEGQWRGRSKGVNPRPKNRWWHLKGSKGRSGGKARGRAPKAKKGRRPRGEGACNRMRRLSGAGQRRCVRVVLLNISEADGKTIGSGAKWARGQGSSRNCKDPVWQGKATGDPLNFKGSLYRTTSVGGGQMRQGVAKWIETQ